MKKIFIFMMLLGLLLMSNNKEEVVLVNKEIENEEMVVVLVTIPGLNTNNFSNYFDDNVKVIGVYPEVNILYKNKIGDMYYEFNGNSIKDNLNKFSNYYKTMLKKHNFYNDLTQINYLGINIEKVRVYVNSDTLDNFIHGCTNCEYKKTSTLN